jgi:acetolactate synthase-1/2/3 large subunit
VTSSSIPVSEARAADPRRDTAATGGRLVVDWMMAHGLRNFFNVPGESFISVLDALSDHPEINVVTNRHESGASFAADAFAKMSNRPAVCMATRGPGASNLSIGVQTAYYDSTPMIALLGLIPTTSQGSRTFQEFDPVAMFGSIAKRVFVVNRVESLPAILDQAFDVAVTGRPGPVVIGLPIDVLGPVPPGTRISRGVVRSLVPAVNWDAEAIAALLTAAEHPALLAGTQAVRGATADRIHALAERTGLPMFAAWRRYSAVDNAHPLFAGSLGRGASAPVKAAVRSSDLVLSFGFAIDDITAEVGGFNRAGLTVVQMAATVDPDLPRLAASATVVQVPLAADDALDGLLAWCTANPDAADRLRERHGGPARRTAAANREVDIPRPRAGRVHADHLVHRFNEILPGDATVVSDVGNFSQWLLRYVRFDRDRASIGPLNGAMGYGIPGAIGAVLAAPGRPTWCVGGDGGIAMTLSEMAAAVSQGLEIAVLVIDNGVYGTIRNRQDIEFPGRPLLGTATGGIDFAALARAFGWSAWTINDDSEVDAILGAAVTAAGCRLVHALVEERPWTLP